MSWLVDTSVLVRRADPADARHHEATAALASLQARNERLYIVPQNIYELWVVATRPRSANGMGLSPAMATALVDRIEETYLLLPDQPDLYAVWRRLVRDDNVSGRPAHDARLVAAMHTHGISRILTFNVADFLRYPGLQVVHPRDVPDSIEGA